MAAFALVVQRDKESRIDQDRLHSADPLGFVHPRPMLFFPKSSIYFLLVERSETPLSKMPMPIKRGRLEGECCFSTSRMPCRITSDALIPCCRISLSNTACVSSSSRACTLLVFMLPMYYKIEFCNTDAAGVAFVPGLSASAEMPVRSSYCRLLRRRGTGRAFAYRFTESVVLVRNFSLLSGLQNCRFTESAGEKRKIFDFCGWKLQRPGHETGPFPAGDYECDTNGGNSMQIIWRTVWVRRSDGRK